MAKQKMAVVKKENNALVLNGITLEVSPARAEYTRLLKRFTELAVAQRNAAEETIDDFEDKVDEFCECADSWAHTYIDAAADLAVEELIKKGCLDVDRDSFVSEYLNSYSWDKCIKELLDLAQELEAEEEAREERRVARTDAARNFFDEYEDDGKFLNHAGAGLSGLINIAGRLASSCEYDSRKKGKFKEDRDAYLNAIYMTIRTSVDELIQCLSDKKLVKDGGGVSVEDCEKASRLFNNLSSSKMDKAVAMKVKMEILRLNPYNKDFYEWCFMDDGDPSGELEKIADYFGVSLDDAKSVKFANELGESDYKTEEDTLSYREKAAQLAKSLRYDASEKLNEIDEKLAEFDLKARTVDERVFDTRDEAGKQRELSAFEKDLDLSTEDKALKAKKDLESKIKDLGVDGAWKLVRTDEALAHFDELARTVDKRIFDTRKEAALQRELSEFEKAQDLSSEESALKARENLVAKISALKIDGDWKLKRVDAALKKFDELARTTFGIVFDSREAAADATGNKDSFYAGVVALAERSGESGFYSEGGIPAKKLANAVKAFPIPDGERVLCLTDTTFFGSGKTGLAITEIGLRWANGKSVASTKTFLRWGDIAKLQEPFKRLHDTNMVFGSGAVYDNSGSNVDHKKMSECLNELYSYCHAATFDFGDNVSHKKKQTVGKAKAKADAPAVEEQTAPASGDVMACTDFHDVVEKAFDSLEACGEVFVGDNIPSKKRTNAHKSMEVKESADDIEMLVDATVFGSAKDGLVITPCALYFKNGFESPFSVKWLKLKPLALDKDGNVKVNTKVFHVIGMESDERKKLAMALEQVRQWVISRDK